MSNRVAEWAEANREIQLELNTVVAHKPHTSTSSHVPAGVRLAKMLRLYEDSPSSQLWSDVQAVSREILKS